MPGQFTNTLALYAHTGSTDEALLQSVATSAGIPLCSWRNLVSHIYTVRNGAYASFISPGNQFSSVQKLEVGKMYIVAIPSGNLPIVSGVNGQVDLIEISGSPSPSPVALFTLASINTKFDSDGFAERVLLN